MRFFAYNFFQTQNHEKHALYFSIRNLTPDPNPLLDFAYR